MEDRVFLAFDVDGMMANTYPIFRRVFDEAARAMNVRPYRLKDEQHIRSLEAAAVLRFHGIEPPRFPRFNQLLRAGMEQRRSQAKMGSSLPSPVCPDSLPACPDWRVPLFERSI